MPGVHLTTCREIEAATALLGCYRFDLLVTDLSVSQLGGLEGMRLIRFVTANFPDTAVVVLSGYVDDSVRSLCSMLGVTAVLEKPEGLGQLRKILLDRRTAALANPEPEPVDHGVAISQSSIEDGHADKGEVQQVELLEDFLASNTIRAVLQPVVALHDGDGPFEVFGVEGLARGPNTSVLGSPSFLLAYAARKELPVRG